MASLTSACVGSSHIAMERLMVVMIAVSECEFTIPTIITFTSISSYLRILYADSLFIYPLLVPVEFIVGGVVVIL